MDRPDHRTRRVLIVTGAAAGLAGLAGAVFDAGFGTVVFLAAVLVLHDAVFMPLVLLIGRRVPVTIGVVALSLFVVGLPIVLT